MAVAPVKLISITNPPPDPSFGGDVHKGEPLLAGEYDQNLVNIRNALPIWSTLAPVDGVGVEGQFWIRYVE